MPGTTTRATALAAILTGGLTGSATAQDTEFAAQGQALYEQNCALCHGASGAGDPPHFPALSGNPILADLNVIVANIHEGREAMPPFPTLDATEIAAIATYVRGAWENSFPGADAEEVARILEELGGTAEEISIWDGVYTQAQAERGAQAYGGPCGLCHGRRLDGAPDDPDMRAAPPLARYKFIRSWDGRSLATLFDYTRSTMPQSNPGYMDDQTYVDIIAHMLATSGAPAGQEELTPDPNTLARIVIGPEAEEAAMTGNAATGVKTAEATIEPVGMELGCSAAGYDVLLSNPGSEPIAPGRLVDWEVPFARKSGTFEIRAPLAPGSNVFVSGALGSDYQSTPQPCTARLR